MEKLLIQLFIIIAAAQVFRRLLKSLRQPAVVGEVLAGIALGPSLFGAYFPKTFESVFGASSLQGLNLISQLGLILFIFVVGLHSNPQELWTQGRKVFTISAAGILLPFALGLFLGPHLYKEFAQPSAGKPVFSIFCGIAFSITAFPVLARIIHDRKIGDLAMSRLSLACAAVGDFAAWIALAAILGWARSGNFSAALKSFALSSVGILAAIFLAAPLLRRFTARTGIALTSKLVVCLLALFGGALYFAWAGVHFLFGAFVMGAAMPREGNYRALLQEKVEFLGSSILLPAFFAITGLQTRIGLLGSAHLGRICALVVGVAVIGKFGGAASAARLCGIGWRDSAFLGVLMNTRGLMELVALNLGLELGWITPAFFTVMVLMALFTTIMAGPLLDFLAPAAEAPKWGEGEPLYSIKFV